MARPNGSFGDGLLVAVKAFIAGCSGCLGVGFALVVSVVMVSVFFQAQFVALIRTINIPIFPIATAVPIVPVVPTVCTTPTSQVVAIEIFISQSNNPPGVPITQIKIPLQQTLFICVRSSQAVSVSFTVRITQPNGQVIPFGGQFATDPAGKTVCLGQMTSLPSTPGVFRIDALIGDAIVGSTVLTVVS